MTPAIAIDVAARVTPTVSAAPCANIDRATFDVMMHHASAPSTTSGDSAALRVRWRSGFSRACVEVLPDRVFTPSGSRNSDRSAATRSATR